MDSNPTLSSSSVMMFQVASQLWYFGMVYTTFSTLFRDDLLLSLEMVICLSTTLYTYSILWTLRWYGLGEVLLCSFTALGLFAAFLSIARLVSSINYRSYTMSLTVFLIGSTMISILLFLHAPAMFFDTCSMASSVLLVLAPSIGYQLSSSLAPLEYYVCAAGFSAFWLINAVIAVGKHEPWWPLLLATGTLALTVQQLLFFFRNRLVLSLPVSSPTATEHPHRHLRGMNSFVLRELRFNHQAIQPGMGIRRDSEMSYQSVSEMDLTDIDEDPSQQYQYQQQSPYHQEAEVTVPLSPLHWMPADSRRNSYQSQTSRPSGSRLPLDDETSHDIGGYNPRLSRLSLLSTSSFLQQRDSTDGKINNDGNDYNSNNRSSRRIIRHRRESSLDSFYSYGSCFDDEEEIDDMDEEGSSRIDSKKRKKKSKKSKKGQNEGGNSHFSIDDSSNKNVVSV